MTDDHGAAARDILAEQMYLEERGENDPDWRDAPFEIQRGYRSMIQRHMRHLSAAGYQIVPHAAAREILTEAIRRVQTRPIYDLTSQGASVALSPADVAAMAEFREECVNAAMDDLSAAGYQIVPRTPEGMVTVYRGKELIVGIPLSAAINARNAVTHKWTKDILSAAIARAEGDCARP